MRSVIRPPHSWIVVPAILLFFFLALHSATGDSPTMDEQNHLARGLAFLETGDPRLSVEHPPLVNTLSALPVWVLLDVRLPTDHPSWSQPGGWYAFADLLLWEYNNDVTRMIFLARLPIIFLTIGLALVAYHAAREMWAAAHGKGRPSLAPLLAFAFVILDPNILAHGRYTTTDLGGALFVFLAAFLLWRLWGAPSDRPWSRLASAAVGLGLAFGSKLSTLAFAPIFALLALLPLYRPGKRWSWRAGGRRLGNLLLAGAGALVVVWTIFGFQWGPLQFQHTLLTPLNGANAPMPTFWSGIEQIILLSEGGRPSFLLGQTSTEGFLAYFPIAFLTKTPLATLLMLPLALAIFWRDKEKREVNGETRSAIIFLLLPALLYFLLSMTSDLNIGYRHLLPILPFLYVLIAGGLARVLQRPPTNRSAATRIAAVILPIALLFSTLAVHPHYVSFFNVASGRPSNGYRILVDSNVDWGQDLLRLRRWMAAHEVETIKLSWFGSADPAYYGIDYEPLPGLPRHFDLWWNVPFDADDPEPGVYAISASNLWELPLQEEKYVFPWFRARPPDDRVGYSILIYQVP